MPSPKAFVRQITEQNLDPKKAYKPSEFDKEGKLKLKTQDDVLHNAVKADVEIQNHSTSQDTDVEVADDAAKKVHYSAKSKHGNKKHEIKKFGEVVSVQASYKEKIVTETADDDQTNKE